MKLMHVTKAQPQGKNVLKQLSKFDILQSNAVELQREEEKGEK